MKTKAKIKAFALVRNKDGKPRIDDIKNIPLGIWELLTDKEKQEVLKDGGNAPSSNT